MIRVIHPRARGFALALLFSFVPLEPGWAKPARPPADQGEGAEVTDRSVAVGDLAAQVAEIAHSSMISRAKKEKRISTAVRIAVVAATAYKERPEEILGAALELTEAAARAAPAFAEVIANAASFSPSLSRIDAAPGQIRTAAYAAAKNPKAPHRRNVAVARAPEADQPETADMPESGPTRRAARPAPTEAPEPGSRTRDYATDSEQPDRTSPAPKMSLDSNSKFSVTADLSVRRDDNVYLTSANKVGDTIIAVTPGVEYAFGQNSLAHGSASYKNALTKYVNKSSPNLALSNGAADFGYDSGSLAVTAAASFQQLNQNNNEVAALGQQAIYRRDVLDLAASVESHLTAKTSVKTGATLAKSTYKTGGLTGSQDTEVPVKFYFETTPKVSLAVGAGYRWVKPQNGTNNGHDLDYNLGARGDFTAKLNGEFSLDYRTRTVANNPRQKLWGFNGALNYEVTPKTSSRLVFSRDFSTGALGETLTSSNYALKFSADLTRQWLLSAGLTYRDIAYGPTVFIQNNSLASVDRNDRYWEGNLQATYLFRSWLSATANYIPRTNHSTLPGAEFSNNLFSLMVGWRY